MTRIQWVNEQHDPRRVAIHEAGHAILAVKKEIPFIWVKLGPLTDPGSIELAQSPFNSVLNHSQEELLKYQEFAAAGSAAEHLVFGNAQRSGRNCDKERHDRLAVQTGQQSYESSMRRAVEQLESRELNMVADSLEERRSLEFEDVCRIIGVIPW